jgi:hypothetical protein
MCTYADPVRSKSMYFTHSKVVSAEIKHGKRRSDPQRCRTSIGPEL